MSDTSLPVHEQYKSLKKTIYSVRQLFIDYSGTMFLAPHILIPSWMIHFFLFMNGLSTQCRKQSIMWENIWMIVHEWCFYLRSWTSTFNPFMNGSFLPVHEWFIIVFDKILMIIHKLPWIRHSWTGIGTCSWTHVKCMFMNTCKMHVHELM